jgi:AAA15 family ATPase/GTPase
MELKLKFREKFKGFASIKNTFEIDDLKAFSVISGVNGVGKSQFLQAISKGHIEVEIDGMKIDSNSDIKLFNHETFKLKNEQNLSHDFLEKKKATLISLFSKKAPLNQFPQLHNSVIKRFNEDNILLAFIRLLDIHDQDKNIDGVELDVDAGNVQAAQQLNKLRQAAKQENWSTSNRQQLNTLLKESEFQRYFEPDADLGRITSEMFSRAIDRHQNDEILEAGFGEVFKKANDRWIRYISSPPDKSILMCTGKSGHKILLERGSNYEKTTLHNRV